MIGRRVDEWLTRLLVLAFIAFIFGQGFSPLYLKGQILRKYDDMLEQVAYQKEYNEVINAKIQDLMNELKNQQDLVDKKEEILDSMLESMYKMRNLK